MTKLGTLLGALLLGLLLAACGENVTPTTTPVPPAPTTPAPAATATPTPPTPGPAPSDTPGPPATATPGVGVQRIIFERVGGFAGFRDVLEIGADGTAHLSSRGLTGTLVLPADRLNALVAQLEAAQFFSLQDKYDAGGVADDIYDNVTFSQNGRSKTVTVAEIGGKDITPAALRDIITTLQQIANEVRATAGGPTAGPTVVDLTATPIPAATAATTPTTAPVATTPPTPATQPTAKPSEGSDVIVYQVKGGIAGLDTAMYVDPHGRLIFRDRGANVGSAQLSADQFQELLTLFNNGAFFDLQDVYAPPTAHAPDSQSIFVTYTFGGKSKTVQVDSGAAGVPDALNAILARLADIQAQMRPK
jgi:hypothetical protein